VTGTMIAPVNSGLRVQSCAMPLFRRCCRLRPMADGNGSSSRHWRRWRVIRDAAGLCDFHWHNMRYASIYGAIRRDLIADC
jgi:hypothetical protein